MTTAAAKHLQGARLGASRESIAHHYDTGNEFFALWLDCEMTYSCAKYASESEPLEVAQRRKLDFHIDRAGAAGQARVLDIGCGWGSLLRRLVQEHGVGLAVGLTLSNAQALWIARTHDPRIRVHVQSWADHRPDEPYDSIVCIGALEHFAQRELDDARRIAAYREFFTRCRALLRSNGRMSLQTIAYGTLRRGDVAPFITESIFPGSDLPRLSEIVEATDRLFEIVSLSNDRGDYARTCREWWTRLNGRHDEAARLVGKERVCAFERFLKMSAAGFETGALTLLRISLARIDIDPG